MLDEVVAIKVLRGEFANATEMAKRFKHEIKLARKVSHRNVCRIHEFGEDAGLRYISMEYLEGTDLKQVMRLQGGFTADEAFEISVQVGEGLQAIHDVGIIHRDLKTPNLMRNERGVVRLMDFGIAKGAHESGTGAGLTMTGAVMGTPEYMSPEQCRGEKIDFRSDIYSLGVVSYELFTGQVPFRGDTPVATIFKHIQDPIPLEGEVARKLPPAVIPVLQKLLAKDRNQRYDTAAAVVAALRQAREASAGHVSAPAPPPAEPAGPPAAERRLTGRLEIFVNFFIRRVGTNGAVLQEERTIAENIGRGGARVLTTMASLVVGDIIQLEEIGGGFRTRAEVRGTYVGKDKVRRLNLHFVDHTAPDRLVRTDSGALPRVIAGRTPAPPTDRRKR
jgi:hypothetical protein